MAGSLRKVDPERADAEAVREAAGVLAQGGLVGFPTETVYGIGARADMPEAVARLKAVKQRDPQRPLTIHAADPVAGVEAARYVPPRAVRLLRRFWPGPLTVVFAGGPDREGTGVRVPAHPIAAALLAGAGGPVAASSANLSGEEPLIDGESVARAFGDEVDLVLDAGPSSIQQASTVVKLTDTSFTILREGLVTGDMVRRHVTTRIVLVCTGNSCRSPMAEGLLKKRLADAIGVPVPALASCGFEVSSAGTSAGRGYGAANEAIAAMAERGIDISGHRSSPIETTAVEAATWVIAVSPSHHQAMLQRWPRAADKLLVLDERGIVDPIGGSLDVYRASADHIDDRLRGVVDMLFGDALGRAVLAKRPGADR